MLTELEQIPIPEDASSRIFEAIEAKPWSTVQEIQETMVGQMDLDGVWITQARIQKFVKIMLDGEVVKERETYFHRGPPYTVYAVMAHEGEPVP